MKLKKIMSLLLCGLLMVSIPVEVISASTVEVEVGVTIKEDEVSTVVEDNEGDTTTAEDIEVDVEENYSDIEVSGEDVAERAALTVNRARAADIAINASNFPDANFREYVLTSIDKNDDGKLSTAEREDVEEMLIGYSEIKSLQGVEFFINLSDLSCSNNQLVKLDVSKNINLRFLICNDNSLISLDVGENINLEELDCIRNDLTSLDVSKAPNLKEIDCRWNNLTSLNISNNPGLIKLDCNDNELISLDVSKAMNLEYLDCGDNELINLNISNNPKLKNLFCCENELTSLDVSKALNLEDLSCDYNRLTSLNISNNRNLKSLNCESNELISLNVSNNSNLGSLGCGGNKLTSLDVSKNLKLESLFCYENELTSLDVSKNFNMQDLHCGDNQLTSIRMATTLGSLISFDCSGNELRSIPNLRDAKELKGASLEHGWLGSSFIDNYFTENELRSKLPEHLIKEIAWLNEQINNQKVGTIKETKYTVTFDANGGSVSTKSKVVEAGKTYGTLPIPTRTGHTFLGWYTAKSGGSQITSNMTVNIRSNHAVYAQWNNNQYTITFNANGGSVSTKNKTVEAGKTYGTLPTPTRTGHIFLGWYTAKSGGSKITSSAAVNISSNQTLYAQWGKQYKVTFNVNGGKVTKKSKTVVTGTTYGTLPKPTRKNYTFEGWYTAKKGGKKIVAGTQVNLTKNQTLYARWSLRTYTVKFNANKGTSGKMKNLKLTYGKAKKLITNKFKRKGYQFVGWNTKANGKGKTYKNNAVVKNRSLTLYAQWKKIKK